MCYQIRFRKIAFTIHRQIRYLSGIGGKSVREFVRRALSRVLTNELMSIFSMKGKKGKRRLQALQLYACLVGTC